MNTQDRITTLYVKNMVCERCIRVVREELEKIGLLIVAIRLGEVELESEGLDGKMELVREVLERNGFGLADGRKAQIIEKIKAVVVNLVHYNQDADPQDVNYSDILADELALDYHYLSTVFSQHENMTIEKYIILQKIERVKELLKYDELSLSEIAYRMGYSSVAHLSAQFKKVTGLSASQYKKLRENTRTALDKIEDLGKKK